MQDSNIEYQTEEIASYYSTHRLRWMDFYESERQVIGLLNLKPGSKLLDIGCGCGGLGLALHEKFECADYTGVEVNRQAVLAAEKLNPNGKFIHSDILKVTREKLQAESFDFVFSLSCIDWNVAFSEMFDTAFSYVKPGGEFLASFRLTNLETVIDPMISYQYINFSGKKEGEKAPYVVLNARDLLNILTLKEIEVVKGYGYWGRPSSSAITPYSEICFAVFAMRKAMQPMPGPSRLEIDIPLNLFI